MLHPAVICITIQRTLSFAKVRYLIGDKECFKIFSPYYDNNKEISITTDWLTAF